MEKEQVDAVAEEIDTAESVMSEAELNGTATEEVAAPNVESAKEVQPSAEKPKWDTERQRADQAEANFRKATQEREELASRLDATSKSAESLQAKLDEYAKANDVDVDNLDADLIDPNVLGVLKTMKRHVEAADNRVKQLENVAKTYEQSSRQQELAQAQEKTKNELLSDVEGESEVFPKFRNEAIAMADKVCADRGYSPVDRYEAAKILRGCYQKVSVKPKTTTKTPIPSDTGTATVAATPKEEIKSGSLRDVIQQYRAKAGLG
jgi:exonuclease VII large subunit